MFLEVNDEQLVIIGRPTLLADDVPAWRELCKKKRCVFLVPLEQVEDWTRALGGTATVLPWNNSTIDSVAANIKSVLINSSVEPHQTVFVASSPDDVRSAITTRVGTVLFRSGARVDLPDAFATSADELLDLFGTTRHDDTNGYIGETSTTVFNRGTHLGRGGRIVSQPGYLRGRPELDPGIADNLTVVILGRYFVEADERHDKHQYTNRILKAKNGLPEGVLLASPLGGALNALNRKLGFDIVTRIPPKAGKSDYLGAIVTDAARRSDQRFRTDISRRVRLDALRFLRPVTPQKLAGGWSNRAANVAGSMSSIPDVTGKRVVLVDDVLTSGATAVEGARALFDAGAADVIIVPLGIAQHVVNRRPDTLLSCPECGAPLVLRFSSKTHDGFFGCTRYPDCKHITEYIDGVKALNSTTSSTAIEVHPDISF